MWQFTRGYQPNRRTLWLRHLPRRCLRIRWNGGDKTSPKCSLVCCTLWLCQNSYWKLIKWPSRNSWFSHETWWFSIVFCMFTRPGICSVCSVPMSHINHINHINRINHRLDQLFRPGGLGETATSQALLRRRAAFGSDRKPVEGQNHGLSYSCYSCYSYSWEMVEMAENHRLVFQFESLSFQFTDFTDFRRRHRSNAEFWHNSWWTAALARKTGRTPGAFFGCDNVWQQDGRFSTTNTQE